MRVREAGKGDTKKGRNSSPCWVRLSGRVVWFVSERQWVSAFVGAGFVGEALGSSGRGAGHLDLSVLTKIGQIDRADGRGAGFICLGRQRGIDERENKQSEMVMWEERDTKKRGNGFFFFFSTFSIKRHILALFFSAAILDVVLIAFF